MARSLYESLGVTKDATPDAIRAAYRKLARKHHPDVTKGDKTSEEKFKEITAAYEVLSDDKRRKAYDEFGDISLQSGFDADKYRAAQAQHARWSEQRASGGGRTHQPTGFHAGDFDFGDLGGFGEFFRGGGRRATGPQRGGDLSATIQIDLRQAVEGAEFTADIPGQGPVRVRIPPGADTGSTLRVAGKGSPGANGGPPGDLVIEVAVRPHPQLRRDGQDLYLRLPVTLDEAYNGASVDVPTFEGPITLKIPARSQNGSKLRVRGRGVPRKGTRGDLYVELDVRVPDKLDDDLARCLREAGARAYSAPVRDAKKRLD